MFFDDKILVENYELNPLTMLIEPFEHENKIYSKITEFEKGELYSPLKPTDLLKKGCEYNFTEFNTCKKTTQRLVNTSHKTPIAVDPYNSVYMIPTVSPSHPDCIWISLFHILEHAPNDAYSTMVRFRDKHTIILPISHRSFCNQFYKTLELKKKITEKLIENEQRAQFIRRKRYFDEGLHSFVNERYGYM